MSFTVDERINICQSRDSEYLRSALTLCCFVAELVRGGLTAITYFLLTGPTGL